MHSVRQTSNDHAQLRRVVTRKLESTFDSGTPQFGGLGGGVHRRDRGGVPNHGQGQDGAGNSEAAHSNSNNEDRQPSTTQAPIAPSPANPVPAAVVAPNGGVATSTGGNGGGNTPASSSNNIGSVQKVTSPLTSPTGATTTAATTAAAGTTKAASSTASLETQTLRSSHNPTLSSDSPTVSGVMASPPISTDAPKSARGISSAAIAVIVVISLLALFLLLVLGVRRRWVARRRDRMQHWWFSRNQNLDTYDDKTEYPEETVAETRPTPVDDRSATPLDFSSVVPTAPPAAEVRLRRGTSHFGHVLQAGFSRFSVDSTSSAGSNTSQFIVICHALERDRAESFKFPKPPYTAATEAESVHSRRNSGTSGASYAAVCSAGTNMPASSLSPPPIIPLFAAVTRGDELQNPSSSGQSIYTPNYPVGDPFDDVYALPAAVAGFPGVETVRRAFRPNLPDELPVIAGDRVQILEVFEDGWARVLKLRYEDDGDGSSPKREGQTGLMPVACLQDPTPDFSPFLHAKRMQSFSS